MRGRLAAWSLLAAVQILLAYGARVSSGKPPRNAVYHYSLALSGLIEYGIVLGIVLAIARGRVDELLALRRPQAWGTAIGLSIGVLVGIYALTFALSPVLHAGEEQGLTPPGWDGSRAGAFAASFLVIVFFGPFVEEAMFRGLGYSLIEPFGGLTAIVVVGITFGLAHGLFAALPILAVFGAGLAYIRSRTQSLYPCFLTHAAFNAVALIASVAA